ncbi:TonB-dependent receptor [Gaoshiqia sp. Z1-71]|uniref:TonB-dependent receptor n=1 Tax=Gaoshiqia hydrogeniformans TaxID=3290090 RepID=UPI003BF78B31
MKKKRIRVSELLCTLIKIWKIMRLGLFFLFLFMAQSWAVESYSQQTRLTMNMKNAKVIDVLNHIENQTDFFFLFNQKLVDVDRRVDIDVNQVKVETILSQLFGQTNVSYLIKDRQIVLTTSQTDFDRFQQQKAVSGTVTNEQGEPLPGVTVVVKGTSAGTITDINGDFTLKDTGSGNTLVFSFVGMENKEILIGSQSVINVSLKESTIGLEEVVAIGYGTMKKSDLTGSVSSVKTETLESVPVYNMEQALKVGAAGVQVTQNSGNPGGRIEVRIRGGNSMIGDNQPLYVVDGFPMVGGINFLNPSDIESVDILKDASATAIYGARGANGVVIITSKRGKAGQKSRIEVNSFFGFQKETKRYDLLDAKEYAIIANEWLKNAGQQPYFNVDQVQSPGTDWQDAVLRTAPLHNHTITFSGSSDKTRYSLSGNYYDQEGILINSGVKRGSVRLNLDHEMNSWLKMAVNMNLSRRERLSVPVDNGYRGTSVLSAAASAPPTLPVYDQNGIPTQIEKAYSFGSADMRNPMIFAGMQTRALANNVVGNGTFDVKLTNELSFKTLLGIEYAYSINDYFEPLIFENDRGSGSQSTYYRSSFLNENLLTYVKNFGEKHSLTAVGGYTYQTSLDRNFGVSISGFSNNTTENYNLGAAETVNTPSSGYSEWVLASWLARANYSFSNKYLLTVSVRADGSSRFGANNKWATFPSAAFAWRVSEEPFMTDAGLISDLKLRASYGVTGNTALSPYRSLDRMLSTRVIYANQEDEIGYYPAGISNSELRWESTEQIDVGFDLAIMNNRFRLTADYYKKNTTDLLAEVPLPPSVGFGSILQNIGEIQNQGFEFTLNADILRSEVKWDVAVNFSTNKNKVIEIAGGSDVLSAGQTAVWSSSNIARVGKPLGSFFGYLEDGLTENGFIKYKDVSGPEGVPDGIVNALDRVILGNPSPDFFYGLNSNLSYKNFELNVILDGVYGNEVFNATNGTHLNSFQRGSNQFKDIMGNYWTAENPDPNAKYPKISSLSGFDVSDRFIEDGSYLRVRSLRLAYNLPVRKMGLTFFDFAQIYISGTNLFTFTDYTGLDPEVNTKGVDDQNIGNRLNMGHDQSGYPNAKTYAIGFKLNF